MGGPDIDFGRQQAEADGDPVVMAVHWQSAAVQAAERQNGSACFRADSRQALQPGAGLRDAQSLQEVQRQLAALGGDAPQDVLDAGRFLLRPGAGRQRRLDSGEGRIAQGGPAAGKLGLKVLVRPVRVGVFGAVGQQRGNQLAQGVKLMEMGDGAMVLGAQPVMDNQHFFGRRQHTAMLPRMAASEPETQVLAFVQEKHGEFANNCAMTPFTLRRTAALGGLLLACAGSGFAAPSVPVPATLTPKTPQPHRHLPQNSAASAVAPNKLTAAAALALVQGERDKYWLNAKTEVYRSTLELIAQNQTELLRRVPAEEVLRGNPLRREIALTIDDGPHPTYTPRLLQILKENGVPATFFVVGEKAEEYPDLIRAEVAEGSAVGNHTYDHVSLVKIPPEYIDTEIEACGEVLKKITGRSPHLFRPPGGQYNLAVSEAAEALGYKIILYSDDPGDYADPGTGVIESRTLDTISNGGIILLHDGSAQTLVILPQIIQRLKARGFKFVTVDDLLRPGG